MFRWQLSFGARKFSVWAVGGLAVTACVLPCGGARADGSGVPFWLSGGYSSFAAVAPQPGLSMPTQIYYYDGSANAGKTIQHGNTLNLGLSSQLAVVFFTPTWALPGEKWLGGQPSFSLTFGGGWNSTSAALSVSTLNGSQSFDVKDTIWGGADLYPQVQISWNSGYYNWMTYATGDIPTGAYQPKRLSNIGLGHGAADIGAAYTFLNTDTGTEASAVVGFTWNSENGSTNVQSGIDSHLDFALSQFLSQHIQVGLVGYVYYQLSGDSGSGNKVGAFKSRVAAVGPEVGYAFTAFGHDAYVNLRGYSEFWTQNRLEGKAAYLTISIPLGPNPPGSTKKPPAGG